MADSREDGAAGLPSAQATYSVHAANRLIAWAFVAMLVLMVATLLVMVWACAVQVSAFQRGIDAALPDKDYAAVAAFSTGVAASFVKTLSILMSFLLIFAGAAYVLLPIQVKYRATGETGASKGTLETNSPGLVLVSIGAILAGICVLHDVRVHYDRQSVTKSSPETATGTLQTGCNPVTNPKCDKVPNDGKDHR